jgi:ribokinase
VHAAIRSDKPTRRGVTLIDPSGERTITTLGDRLQANGPDELPWERLAEADAVYVCAGDADAFRFARNARMMVVASRALDLLAASGVAADVVVGSARDPSERFDAGRLEVQPRIVVRTEGIDGGSFESKERSGRYEAAAPPSPVVDTYGCGDSFAAGLTFALGEGRRLDDALAFAARCGAACAAGRGPYTGQLSSPVPRADRGSRMRL